MKRLILLFSLSATFLFAQGPVPKNIILFIGDGMGPAQVTAGKIAKGTLELERCPVAALVTTWCANKLVTDSAAGGTALATGFKTDKGMLSLSPDGIPLKTAAETAREKGKATGLVVTCALTHATPAAFAAHVKHRNQTEEIAAQIASSGIDVLFGGGLDHFQPFLPELQEDRTVVTSAEEFRTLGEPERVAALLAPEHLPPAAEREIPLKEMTQKAIELLSRDPDGFFLMVEGSQIDWGGHQNDADYLISEMVDFDDAVGAGLDFAERNSNTLVIVTADHETGGFAILDGSLEKNTVTKTGFSTDYHSAGMVPLFAFGPGSSAVHGIIDNTDVGRTMIRFLK